MWLKMYLRDLYVDKANVEFGEMETVKERQCHLENLARELKEDNKKDIFSSGIEPAFYIHEPSRMNTKDFEQQTWKEIIEAIGSTSAKNNIEELSHRFAFVKEKEIYK
jgi:hypothetical protein